MTQIKLSIPNNWNDITIGKYQEYIRIQKSSKTHKTRVLKSLALLCDTTPKIVARIAQKDLNDIMSIVSEFLDNEPKTTDFKKIFTLEGEEYGFVPNLSRLTAGEYIDLESYTKNATDNLHIIMSILYRKITNKRGDRYAIESYKPDEFKEIIFKDCPMDIALGSLGFFLTLGETLVKTSHNFLSEQEKKAQIV